MLVDGQGNFGCFTGDTKIKLVDGTEKSFAELAKLPPDEVFYVYSVNRDGKVVIGEGKHARVTRKNAELIELMLDNGEKVRCTPDHRFMLRDGTYKEAQDLTPDDSLMPGYFDTAPVKKGLNEYLMVCQPNTGKYDFVHHLADEFNAENGQVREFNGPFVRHHKNFNRWDNTPPNIERLEFMEHLHLHAAQIKELWENEDFRAAQRQGVQRYYSQNPQVLIERRQRFIEQNQDETFRRENAQRTSQGLKRYYASNPAASDEISRRMRALWQDPEYRQKMREALRGVEKRPLTPAKKARVARIISEKSRAMWGNDEKRTEIVEAISRALSSPNVRAKLSKAASQNWQNPEYRAKFSEKHFSKMAHKLWENPKVREAHRAKIARQWQDDTFRQAQSEGVQRSNLRRMQDNPDMMRELSQQAGSALHQNWQNPDYKKRVMRRKIAGYVHRLIQEFPDQEITPELYEAKREQNWIPSLQNALKYFGDFKALVEAGHNYNHRIIAKRCLTETADTYDITVDQHHNFLLATGVFVHNSIDSDNPAAMRYTEIRMKKITHEMLEDIDKETIDFVPNYDESELEPTVFPTRIPNLLINGSSGIAVGMATNIPPHNLKEVINACVALIDDPSLTIEALMKHLPCPDFPTAAIINGTTGILEAYSTGRGRVSLRARTEIEEEEDGGKEKIIVTELPYQVNKARLVEKIAELIKEKKIEGISALRDESDKDGIRIVIELQRGEIANVVLNNLFQHTQMQTVFSINMVALVDKQPRLLSLKQLIELFIRHRREIVTRRSVFELRKARERAHILEGLAVALSNIDAMIVLIKAAKNPQEARQNLSAQVWKPGVVIEMLQGDNVQASRPDGLSPEFGLTEAGYGLSAAQVQAILELRLHRLTGLEQDKIQAEFKLLLVRINELLEILNSTDRLMQVIRAELLEVRDEYGDGRRTKILSEGVSLSIEDLITEEDMVVTLSHEGYIKAQQVSSYSAQRRGGRGKSATKMKKEDFIDKLFVANTHDIILCFSSFGKVYWLKVHQLPQASRTSRGKPIVNLLPLEENERINAVLPVREFANNKFVFMATAKGRVKKTSLPLFSRLRSNGLIAIGLTEDDQLIGVDITDGQQDVMLFSKGGKAVRFSEEQVRVMGRTARGVRGINLADEDQVISLIITHTGGTVLTATVNGFGKRTPVEDYPVKRRAGKGVITIKTNERNGKVVGAVQVEDEDDIVLISSRGTLVRTQVEGISVVSRNTQGVNLITLGKGEKLVGLDRILDLGAGEE
jgi:DNA gyrase subunit A